MRKITKYKKLSFYNKSRSNHSFLSELPKKIYSFKKTKWKILQSFGKETNRKLFINNLIIKLKSQKKEWSQLRSYYKDGLFVKNNLNNYFDNSFKSSFWKKNLKNKKSLNKKFLFLSCLVLPEFRLDILLWRLQFFKSPFQARQSIVNNEVFINNKKVYGNSILKKGDVISFSETKKIALSDSNFKLLPYVEVDYYTKNIVVLMNWQDLKIEDCYYFINESFDLKKFKSFINF
jgi:ribosomal protein S4